MTVTGVTDCAILAIPRCRLGLRALPLLQVSLTAPAPVPVPVSVSWTPGSLLLRRRGGSLRPIWALPRGYSLRDLPLVGTRRGGGSYCRWGRVRVCPCKRLTHRYQVVVGNDERGG